MVVLVESTDDMFSCEEAHLFVYLQQPGIGGEGKYTMTWMLNIKLYCSCKF